MKNIIFLTAATFIIVATYSCKSTTTAQKNATFNYEDLYKTWVVDTIIALGTELVSTPNIETDKNTYRFTKEGTNAKQGTRTTITSGASIDVPFTLKKGSLHFDPAATFPLLKFDKDGNLVSSNMNVSLPPYKIVALSSNELTLRNNDILMKLKAK